MIQRSTGKYLVILNKLRWLIIIMWTGITIMGVLHYVDFINNTKFDVKPPSFTKAYKANTELADKFPMLANEEGIVFQISNNDGSVLNDATECFETRLTNWTSETSMIKAVHSYYYYMQLGFDDLASGLVTEDGHDTLLVLMMNVLPNGSNFMKFPEQLTDQANMLQGLCNVTGRGNSIIVTGLPIMLYESQISTRESMFLMDITVIPVAIVILMLVLRSVYIMLIPVINIFVAACAAFLSMYYISMTWSVAPYCAPVMLSACVAMSIDYSLFIFSRLREEMLFLKRELYTALDITIATAGKIVIISGCILAVCFLGMCIIPFKAVQTIGVGAALSIFFAVVVNLTLGPAILLVFPSLATFYKSWRDKKDAQATSINDDTVVMKLTYSEESGLMDTTVVASPVSRNAFFYRLGVWVTEHPVFVIVAVTLCLLPFIWPASILKTTLDFTQMLPRDASSVKGWNQLKNIWGVGVVSPFYVLVDATCPLDSNGCFMRPDGFTLTAAILDYLVSTVSGINLNNTIAVTAYVHSMPIDYDAASYMLINSKGNFIYDTTPAKEFRYLWHEVMTSSNDSTVISITSQFDPYSEESQEFIANIRKKLEQMSRGEYPENITKVLTESGYSFKFQLGGEAPALVDCQDAVYGSFLPMITCVMFTVLLLACIAFRSLYIPIRLVLTLTLTQVFVFGMAVMAFQTQAMTIKLWLDSTGIFWVCPVMVFCIVSGLCLDYDVFVVSRIVEFRDMGYSDKSSIVHGLTHTGHIITCAGAIMMVAFFGLMENSELMLNEVGFFLSVSVVLDTLVIRTLLVPALLVIVGRYAYYPKHVPTPYVIDLNIDK